MEAGERKRTKQVDMKDGIMKIKTTARKGVVKEIPRPIQVPSDSVAETHLSFCDERMSQESRVKRMKRDDLRCSRHQDSSSSTSRDYEYPHWKLDIDFVTSRGNLERILKVQTGQDRKGWTMLATRYRGTVYLSHIKKKGNLNYFKQKPRDHDQKPMHWGKRFEVEVTKSYDASSERDAAPAQATSLPGDSSAAQHENEVERHGALLKLTQDSIQS
ncbi:hypothetical protein OS493_036705 [Desmophyllum pertusum]|uniref:Decapping nuclease n=1 Tax=Desmophyllum pertusum TaxID=174260 RepID=A0A9X0D0D8_9CNID|nr:hypothetical protein OS493_036705 [Desmophyllum pertusum]